MFSQINPRYFHTCWTSFNHDSALSPFRSCITQPLPFCYWLTCSPFTKHCFEKGPHHLNTKANVAFSYQNQTFDTHDIGYIGLDIWYHMYVFVCMIWFLFAISHFKPILYNAYKSRIRMLTSQVCLFDGIGVI